eukprot:8859828-Alexandrium_andersonii.AAC.1
MSASLVGSEMCIRDRPPLLLSPTYDPQSSQEEQGRQVAGFLAEVTRTINALTERQSAFVGRLVGLEAAQRTLTESATSAVTSLIAQARAEFQAQGGS